MTEQEAIEALQDMHDVAECRIKNGDSRGVVYIPEDKVASFDIAIKALEENQQYRAIGTPEECQAAVEKQKAKKANKQGMVDSNGKFHTWNGINGKPYLLCPNCGTNLCCEMPYDKKPKYCDDCGQKLDWSDEE